MTTPDKLAQANREFNELLEQHGDAGGDEGGGPTAGLTDADRARLRKKYPSLAQGR